MQRKHVIVHPGFIIARRKRRGGGADAARACHRISAVLAHPLAMYRELIGLVLQDDDDIYVSGTAGSLDEAARLCCILQPDVLVVDMAMLSSGVVGLAAMIPSERLPHILVMVFPLYEPKINDAALKGAHGVLADCTGSELADAIRSVARGIYVFPKTRRSGRETDWSTSQRALNGTGLNLIDE